MIEKKRLKSPFNVALRNKVKYVDLPGHFSFNHEKSLNISLHQRAGFDVLGKIKINFRISVNSNFAM